MSKAKDKKGKKKDGSLRGSQRSLATSGILSMSRRYDLEIEENPIRDPRISRELIELNQWCYEVFHSLEMAADDTFASSDGDDRGWTIADTLDDEETPVNPEVLAIGEDARQRKQSLDSYVIGGDKLKKALRWSLGKGDCFIELGIEREGLSPNKSKDFGVSRSLYLPTFEMFRKESDQGELLGFEQRKYLSHSDPDYFFEPEKIIHLRHSPEFLYGRSLWLPSLDAWADVKRAADNLQRKADDIASDPTIYTFPGISEEEKRKFEQELQLRRQSGTITDFVLKSDKYLINKMANFRDDLSPLIEYLLQCRYKLIIPGFPSYFFPGLESKGGTKELSRSPDRRYSRMRYGWCQLLTGAIKQTIDTEIVLRKGYEWYVENARNKYRILWPEWSESIDGMSGNESENTGSEEESGNGAGADKKPKKGSNAKKIGRSR
jgi:hypothetical protein